MEYWEGLRHVRNDWLPFLFALFSIVPRISAQMLNVLVVGFSKGVLRAGSADFGLLDMAYGFVAASMLLLVIAFFSLLTAYPFLRRSIDRHGTL